MANWTGKSRTNYVRVKDVDALKSALEPFEVKVHMHPQATDFVMFEGETEDGDFPTVNWDDDDEELDFSFEQHVVPHLCEGQVLLTHVIGSEKLRYLNGYASAYAWDGRVERLSISDIHKIAAEKFGLDPRSIAQPTYQDLPERLDAPVEQAAERGERMVG